MLSGRFLVLLAIIAGLHLVLPAAVHVDAGDSIVLSTQSAAPRLPLAPGIDNTLRFAVRPTLQSATSASIRLVGYGEGSGDPIALGMETPFRRGDGIVSFDIVYRPPVSGMRWLSVQAVLGPASSPLALSPMMPFLVMNTLAGAHSTVYYSPSIDLDFAQTYTNDFDTAWQFIGDTLNSYRNDRYTIVLPADADTFEQGLLAGGYSPAVAAIDKRDAANVNGHGFMWVNIGQNSPPRIDVVGIGHEYSEDRFDALQPGNQGAGWFWDGLADSLGMQLAALVPGAACDYRPMNRWRSGLLAIRDGTYLPLRDISTAAQWSSHLDTALDEEYGEGYTAVQYWLQRFGLASLVQFVQQPKQQASDFAPALQQVLGESMDQFESDYLTAMRAKLNQPPVAVPVTVHLDAGGITPQTSIVVQWNAGQGQGQVFYRTPTGLASGDYAFTLGSDGSVQSTDGKTTLTSSSSAVTFAPKQQGNVYIVVNHPVYQGQAGADGREGLTLVDLFGRAGLWTSFYATTSVGAVEGRAGDCLAPWPDGNQITAGPPTDSGGEEKSYAR